MKSRLTMCLTLAVATLSFVNSPTALARGHSYASKLFDSVKASYQESRIDLNAPMVVGFSPGVDGNTAEAVVLAAINGAQKYIRVAAYSFTSKPIAAALVDAHKRGIDVAIVVDKSQKSEKYTSANFTANMGIPTAIDSHYAIMHNKFMVIDGTRVETGSFNYTSSAAHRNAENALLINGNPGLANIYLKEWNRLWAESERIQPRY